VRLVLKRIPETSVEYKDLTFGGDMRDITVSFAKIRNVLGFDTTSTWMMAFVNYYSRSRRGLFAIQ